GCERRIGAALDGAVRGGEVQPARAGAFDARRGDRRAGRRAGRAVVARAGSGLMSIRRRLLSMFALTTLGLVIALGVRPASLDRIFSAYAVALAGLGLLALTRASRAASVRAPSIFEYSLTPRPEARVRPPELIRIERELTLGAASAAHLHRRLLPLLREAAATRLSA